MEMTAARRGRAMKTSAVAAADLDASQLGLGVGPHHHDERSLHVALDRLLRHGQRRRGSVVGQADAYERPVEDLMVRIGEDCADQDGVGRS
jgi:hypothetical protein